MKQSSSLLVRKSNGISRTFELQKSFDNGLYICISRYMEDEQAILALAALAQPTRLQAFRTLVKHEPAGIAARDLARLLDVPQNTLSSHLTILSRAGLVTAQRHSRSIV